MKQRTRNKLTSMLLVFCMLLSLLPSSVIAADLNTQTGNTELSTPELTETATAAAPSSPMKLAESCNILRYVNEEVFMQSNHIARLNAQETLSSYVFLNSDGTTTVYYMDEEVKFIAADGTVQEKDITLTTATGGYTTVCNDVKLNLPTNPSSGISLVYGNYSATLKPQGRTFSKSPVLENNTVTYPDYFGEGMDLVYTPTLSGVKEDIVLDSYTGVNSFTFMLNTRGLNLYRANGRYFLSPSKVSDMRIELGDIVSFDARGRFSVGTMTATTVMAGSLYQLTITVDEGFLTDENTTYPVSIDPTLEVSDNTHGAGAIEDATLYSGVPGLNSGSWQYLHCGYYDSTYQVSRTAIGVAGLFADDEFWYIPYAGVTSAKFYIREAGWTAGVTVNMHEISTSWSEDTITWNSHSNSFSSTVIASASPSYGSYAEFDITAIIQDWRRRDDQGYGFMLISTNETSVDKTLYSSESGSSNRPYVVVTYDAGIGFNKSYLELEEGEADILTLSGVSGIATWTSSNSSIATVNSSGVVTGIKAGTATITASVPGYTPITCTVYVTIPDGYYRISNKGSGLMLGVADGSFADLTSVQQQNSKSSTAGQLSQIWKITYDWLGEYTIQPAHREIMSLITNFGYARVSDDSANDSYAVWKIEYDDSGYVLRSRRTGRCLHPDGNATTNGTAIAADDYFVDSNFFRWNINSCSLPSGLVLYDLENERCISSDLPPETKYLELGTLSDLSLVAQAIDPSGTYHSITWSSSNPSVATVGASSGVMTGWKRGKATITVSCTINGTVYSESFALIVRETISVINLYDSTIAGDTAIINNIDDAVAFLNKVYNDTLYLYFVMDGAPQYLSNSPVASCNHGANDDCDGSCSSSCTNHHKNVHRIANELCEDYFETNHVIVMWSNCNKNIYCAKNFQGEHTTWDALALVTKVETSQGMKHQPVVQFLTINKHDELNVDGFTEQAMMSIILAHEIAHTLGLNEIYTNSYGDNTAHMDAPNADYFCIMQKFNPEKANTFYQNINNAPSGGLCDYCVNKLKTVMPSNVYQSAPVSGS